MTLREKPQKVPIGYSVRGVVVKAGGVNVVAAAVERHPNAIRLWKTIPTKHAEKVAKMARLPLAVVRPDLASTE